MRLLLLREMILSQSFRKFRTLSLKKLIYLMMVWKTGSLPGETARLEMKRSWLQNITNTYLTFGKEATKAMDKLGIKFQGTQLPYLSMATRHRIAPLQNYNFLPTKNCFAYKTNSMFRPMVEYSDLTQPIPSTFDTESFSSIYSRICRTKIAC